MISTCVLVGLVWSRDAVMEASLRILSRWVTRAVCSTLRRLGALVLQEVLSAGAGVPASGVVAGVSAAGAAGVGVAASAAGGSVAAAVGVGEAASVAGGSVAAAVGVKEAAAVGVPVGSSVGRTTVGASVSVAPGARTASVETADGTSVSVWAGAAGLAAHPRRSIRSRMSARMTVTIVLNRS